MSFIKCDIYCIVSALGGPIRDIACSVAVISTIQQALQWTLDLNSDLAEACRLRQNLKLARLIHDAALQPRPESADFVRIAFAETRELLGQQRRSANCHEQQVLAHLGGREIHEKSFIRIYNVRLEARSGRRCDNDRQIRHFNILRGDNQVKLLQAIHGGR